MSSTYELKKQIEEQKKLLEQKEKGYKKTETNYALRKELTSLKLKNKFYTANKALGKLKQSAIEIGKVGGNEIRRIQKIQEEKQKDGLGFLRK